MSKDPLQNDHQVQPSASTLPQLSLADQISKIEQDIKDLQAKLLDCRTKGNERRKLSKDIQANPEGFAIFSIKMLSDNQKFLIETHEKAVTEYRRQKEEFLKQIKNLESRLIIKKNEQTEEQALRDEVEKLKKQLLDEEAKIPISEIKLTTLQVNILHEQEEKRKEREQKEIQRKKELHELKLELGLKIFSVRSTYTEVEKLEREFKTGLKQTLTAKQQKVISNILKDLLQNITTKPNLYDASNPTHKSRLVLISLIEDNAKKIKHIVATIYQILQMIYHPALHEAHFASFTALDSKIESKLGEIEEKMAGDEVKESKDLISEKSTLEALQSNAKRQQAEWQQLMSWLGLVTEDAKDELYKTIDLSKQSQILKKEFEKLQKSLMEAAASYDALIPNQIEEIGEEIKKLQGEEKILADSTSMFLRDDKNAAIKMAIDTCKPTIGYYLKLDQEKSDRRQLIIDLENFFQGINNLVSHKRTKPLILDTLNQVARSDDPSEIKNISAPQLKGRPILTVMLDLYTLSGRNKKQALAAAQAFGKVLEQPIANESTLRQIQIGSLENEKLDTIDELKIEIEKKDIRKVTQGYQTERALGTLPITLVLEALQIWKSFIEEEAQKDEQAIYILASSRQTGMEKARFLRTIAENLNSIIQNLNNACIPFREKINEMENIRAMLSEQHDKLSHSLHTSRVQGTQEQLNTLAENLRLPAPPISSHPETKTNNKFPVASQEVTVRTQLDQLYQELTAELLNASLYYGVDSQISTVINVLKRLEENSPQEVKPFESKLALDSLSPALQAVYSVEQGSAEEVFYTSLEKIMTGWSSKTRAIDEELIKLEQRLEDQKKQPLLVGTVMKTWLKSASQTTQVISRQRNPYTLLEDALQEYRTKYAGEDKAIDLVEKAQLLEKAKAPEKTNLQQSGVKKSQTTKSEQQPIEVKQVKSKEVEQDNRTFMEKFTADSQNTRLEVKDFLTRQENAISSLEDKIAIFLGQEMTGWQLLWTEGDFEFVFDPVNPNSKKGSTSGHEVRPITPNSKMVSTPGYEARPRSDSTDSRTSRGGSRGSNTSSNNESKESITLNETRDRIAKLFTATSELRNLKISLKSNSSDPVVKDPEEDENKIINRLKKMEWDSSLPVQALEFLKLIPGFEKEGVEFLLSLESNKIADITPKGKFYQIFSRWRQNKFQNGDLQYLTDISKSDNLPENNFLVQLLNPLSNTSKKIKESKGEKNDIIMQKHEGKLQSLLGNWQKREFFEFENAIKGVESEAIQLLNLLIEHKALNAINQPFYKKFISKLLACKGNVSEKRQIVVNAIHQYLYEWTTQVIGDINLYRSKLKRLPSESAHKITYLLDICRKAQVLSEELSEVHKKTQALKIEREEQIKNLKLAKDLLQNKMQEVSESKGPSSLPPTTGLADAIHQFSRRVRRTSKSLRTQLSKNAPMRETATTGTSSLPAEIKLPAMVRVSEFESPIDGVAGSFREMQTVQQGLPKFDGFFEFANQSFGLIGSKGRRPSAEFESPVVIKNPTSGTTEMDALLAAQYNEFPTVEQAENHVMKITRKEFEKELEDLRSDVLAGLARMLFEKVGKVGEDFVEVEEDIEEAKKLSLKESALKSKVLLEFVAKSYQYVCANVSGDDHCFFYALARQLNLMPTDGKPSIKEILKEHGELKGDFTIQRDALRRQCSDELINYKSYYNGIFDDNYLIQLKARGWGDLGAAKLLINAWARQGQPRAIVIVPHDGSPIQICRAPGATEILVIGNQVGMHFQSLESKSTFQGLASEKLCTDKPELELIACYQNYNRITKLNDEKSNSSELSKIREKVKILLSNFYNQFGDGAGFTRQIDEDLGFLTIIKGKTTLTPAQELEIELLTLIKQKLSQPTPTILLTPKPSPKKLKSKKLWNGSNSSSGSSSSSSSGSSSSADSESSLISSSSSSSNSSSSSSSSSDSSSSLSSVLENLSLVASSVASNVVSILAPQDPGYERAEIAIVVPDFKSPLVTGSLLTNKNNNITSNSPSSTNNELVISPLVAGSLLGSTNDRTKKVKKKSKRKTKVAIIEEIVSPPKAI